MIRKCTTEDFQAIYEIINDAATAYRGVIPNDCWKEPYITKDELQQQIAEGVTFGGFDENGQMLGIVGTQIVKSVVLIRHCYVRTSMQRKGIGSKLLSKFIEATDLHNGQILVGTLKAAHWAIIFYEKHKFNLVSYEEKNRLLKRYWSVSESQIEDWVVLANEKWNERQALETEALWDKALSLLDENNVEAAVNVLYEIIKQYPCLNAYLKLGYLLWKKRNFGQAVFYFRTATELYPHSCLASLGLFHILWRMDAFQPAMEEIKRFKATGRKCEDYEEIVQELKEKQCIDDDLNCL
jgi:tetratricopeptide (TPR) repeat protein